jgi:membrane protein implicated in regulation of membrane protease activity
MVIANNFLMAGYVDASDTELLFVFCTFLLLLTAILVVPPTLIVRKWLQIRRETRDRVQRSQDRARRGHESGNNNPMTQV